ncbi:MAG: hypothetical protein EOP06_04445 [Proteobacteria bacterium]|nr:MAG: hypothetical protein EOP06_04445 [Pseudomonadota bacterium]
MKNTFFTLQFASLVVVAFAFAMPATAQSQIPSQTPTPTATPLNFNGRMIKALPIPNLQNIKLAPLGGGAEKMERSMGAALSVRRGSEGVGGGNTLGGVVIENYQQDTSELEVWPSVKKKLNLLRADIPGFGRQLQDRAKETKWYIVPVRIEQLPESITGIAIATEQTAVQVPKEVYIDQTKWRAMTASAKVGLVLHELVLAEYLWKKANPDRSFPAIEQALSMADMRRVSKLVQNYQSTSIEQTANEIDERNFGYYINRVDKKKREKAASDLVSFFASECSKPEGRKLSHLSIILSEFYGQYRFSHAFSQYGGFPGQTDTAYASGQRFFAKQRRLEHYFVPAWYETKKLFPAALADVNVPVDKFKGSLFDTVYPGARDSELDSEMGEQVCRELKSFDLGRLKMSSF